MNFLEARGDYSGNFIEKKLNFVPCSTLSKSEFSLFDIFAWKIIGRKKIHYFDFNVLIFK
jgi:hypothetical protein